MTTLTVDDASGVVSSDLDPFSEEFLSDPLRYEELLRDAGPVIWLPQYDSYALARYEGVHNALSDWETFSSARGVGLFDITSEGHERRPAGLLEADPPRHTELRQVHNKVLNPAFIRGLRETFAQAAHDLLEPLIGAGDIDGIADIAIAFPLTVFPDMMGVSSSGRENLLPAAAHSFNSFGPENWLWHKTREKGIAAQSWLFSQGAPGVAAAGSAGERIHEVAAEVGIDVRTASGLASGLLTPGLDTTMHGLGLALYYLATHPAEWAKLTENPSLGRAAFEEAVRLGAPVQSFSRHTTRDVEVEGVVIPADSHVLLFLGSANRDPRHWPDADRYDITRTTSGHVGFGAGPHSCAGQNVARLEGQAMLTMLGENASALVLTGEPTYELSNSLRGLKTLPLRIEG